jgi:MFS transporter, MFS domain-containing protein family, molybdate-anion transporter
MELLRNMSFDLECFLTPLSLVTDTLYLSYGVNISALFLTGFLSGAIFAPFLGSFVDKFGRKRSCIVYCVLEIVINVMEHSTNFGILMTGRVLGGISTNLLFSAFESWMTTEHRRKGFPESWLSRTYSQCSIVNGTTAILAGIVAQLLEDAFGHIGPFQGAVALTALALMLVLGWEENYGEEHSGDHASSSVTHQFTEAWKTTVSDSRVWRIGFIQALSEGAMYTFVFMVSVESCICLCTFFSHRHLILHSRRYQWVPTLLSLNPPGGLPTGCVFSALMMAITIGGLLYSPLQDYIVAKIAPNEESKEETCAAFVYLLASLGMGVPAVALSWEQSTWQLHVILMAFLTMEFCVGLFMPVAGTLRSKYVPDALQGAILNIFRLPLNAIVVSGTYATDHLDASLCFKLVSGSLMAAAFLQATMIDQRSSSKKKKTE